MLVGQGVARTSRHTMYTTRHSSGPAKSRKGQVNPLRRLETPERVQQGPRIVHRRTKAFFHASAHRRPGRVQSIPLGIHL